MYENINQQFTTVSRQFADTAAQVNRLTIENAENVFGLQLAAFEQNVSATFAFWGELAEVRDLDGVKAILPKGVQIARENAERVVNTSQEVLGRTIKTSEAIAQIAKSQVESTGNQVRAEAEKVVKSVGKTRK